MGDKGPRPSYLISLDLEDHWHSSSIPGHVYSSTSTKKKRTENNESKRPAHATWIWQGGWDSFKSASDLFTYVAVQGKDSVCLVTGDANVLNKSRNHFWMGVTIITIRAHYLFGHGRNEKGMYYLGRPLDDEDFKPFAAVNVVMNSKEADAESDDEGSSVGLNEAKAIGMLMEKMEDLSASSYEETVQTALSALQHLLKRQLMAGTVKVCVEKKGVGNTQLLTSKEINGHLKVINKPPKRKNQAALEGHQ